MTRDYDVPNDQNTVAAASAFEPELEGYMGATIHRAADGPAVTVTMPVDDRLRHPDESVHPTALLFGIDMAAGMCAGFEVLPQWVLTSDMSIYVHSWIPVSELRAIARPLRVGRRNALVEVAVHDGNQRPIATATINHGSIPVTTPLPFTDLEHGGSFTPPRPNWYTTPASQLYEPTIRTGDSTTAATIGLGPTTRNPWGVMHGAVLGHLALTAVSPHTPTSARVEQITLRFTHPLTAATATARRIHTVHTDNGGSMGAVAIFSGRDDTPAVTAHIQAGR